MPTCWQYITNMVIIIIISYKINLFVKAGRQF